ncbi:MAG: PE domain-containing protein [Mycobacterium sp.]
MIATPDLVESAAQDLAGLRSTLAESAATAAGPTTRIATAAQDEVSIAIASLFGNFGQEFQALSAQAQAFHEEFVGLLNAGAGAYVSAEVANAAQVVLGGGALGNIGQSIGGALAGSEAALGQFAGEVSQSLNDAVTAIRNGGAAALLSGEVQTGAQAISNAIASSPAARANGIEIGGQDILTSISGAQAAFGALQAGGAPALINGLNAFGATVAAPYQTLFSNTATNLQAIGNTFLNNPLPLLHQFANNQVFYAEAVASAIQNLPTELATLPASAQAVFQALLAANPAAFLQQVVTNRIGYAQTIVTGLTSAAHDFGTGLLGLPPAFQAGFQALAAGDFTGAVTAVGTGLEKLFLTGFAPIELGVGPTLLPVTPLGALGDLLPILSIPGQMAQNFTNLLPAGSIPGMVAQNFTNLLQAVTNTTATFNQNTFGITFPLPLQLIFDGIGAPATTLMAFGSSVTTFANALQAGNGLGALAAVLDAPAVMANGFLNGQTLLPLPPLTLDDLGFAIQTGASVELGGILTPLGPVIGNLDGISLALPGTQTGGLIPGLLSFGPELAQAIALPAPILPAFTF